MSYSAYPQRGCLRGRPFVPYTVVSTILFILFVWYIYDPPTDGPIEKMDEDHPISHVKVSLRPDAHLCNPDDAMGYTLPASSQARCLDGSLPMFYLRKGTGEGKNKWLIYFEGGGWCFDLPACKARAKTVLGSSNDYPRCLSKDSMKHYISPLRSANPMMSSWNTVRVRYCDGGSYAGDTVAEFNNTKLYFRGHANRMETLKALLPLGLRSAREVVLMGCSAGALGVYLGVDEMADFIHREAVAGSDVVVRGLAVSGFFMEHSSNQTVDIHEAMRYNSLKDDGLIDNKLDYAESMRRVFTMMNLTAGADRKCIASHALHGTTSECIFARHLLPHLTTPTFSVQSQYDHWQILHIHGRNYSDEDVNRYGRSLSMQLLHASLEMHSASNTSGHGVFIESCAHHCVSCSEAHEDTWNGPKVRAHHLDLHSYSPGQAFKLWYARTTNTVVPPPSPPPPLTDLEGSILLRGSEPERHLVIQNNTLALPSHLQVYAMVDRLFVQNASYPCHACCSCAIRR